MIGFSLVQVQQNRTKNKKSQKWCSKNEDEKEREKIRLLGGGSVVSVGSFCCFFLVSVKATFFFYVFFLFVLFPFLFFI